MKDKPFGEAWIADYFAIVDRLDPEETVNWYTEDASFRFANQPPAKGKDAIANALTQFYKLIRSMHTRKPDAGRMRAAAHGKQLHISKRMTGAKFLCRRSARYAFAMASFTTLDS